MKRNCNNHRLQIVVAIVTALSVMILLLGGCGEMGPGISNIKISTAVDQNDRAISPATVFPADTTKLYCSFKLSGFPPDSKIRVEWIFEPEETIGASENASVEPEIYTVQKNTGTISGDGYTSVSVESPWPLGSLSDNNSSVTWLRGNYKVVLYIDDLEKGRTTFKIIEAAGASGN